MKTKYEIIGNILSAKVVMPMKQRHPFMIALNTRSRGENSRHKIFALMLIPLLILLSTFDPLVGQAFASAQGQSDNIALKYDVTIEDPSSGMAHVVLTIPNADVGELKLGVEYSKHSLYSEYFNDNNPEPIRNLEVVGGNAKVTEEPESFRGRVTTTIQVTEKGKVVLEYDGVPMGRETIIWDDYAEIELPSLLLHPPGLKNDRKPLESMRGRITISLDVPRDWITVSTWKHEDNVFIKTLQYKEEFRDYFVAGPFELWEKNAGGLHIVLGLHQKVKSDLDGGKILVGLGALTRLYKTKVFGPLPKDELAFVVVREDGPIKGGDHRWSVSIPSYQPGEKLSLWDKLSHEYVHQWNGWVFSNWGKNTDWFTEGVTTYLSYKGLHDAGVLPEEDYWELMNKRWNGYQHYRRKEGEKALTGGYRKARGFLYTKGCFMSFMLDRAIQRITNSEKDLYDATRYLTDKYWGKSVKNEDLVSAIKTSTGYDPTQIFQDYVYSPNKLPIVQDGNRFSVDFSKLEFQDKLASTISLKVSRSSVTTKQDIIITGSIKPAQEEVEVKLVYTKPDESTITHKVFTDSEGTFVDNFVADQKGSWNVKAKWAGDENHRGAESPSVSFIAIKPGSAAGEREILYDDGEMDKHLSLGGTGHAVRFRPPTKGWLVENIRVYGKRYGEDSQFRIEIWNENLDVISELGPYDYSQYFSPEFEWVEINSPSVVVSGDFYICFFADTKPEYGIRVGYDTDPPHSGRSYIAYPSGRVEKEKKGRYFDPNKADWMIRARGTGPEKPPREIESIIENLELEIENLKKKAKNLESAISRGKVGAIVSIETQGRQTTTSKVYQHQDVEVEVTEVSAGNKVKVEVSSGVESGRTIVLNIDKQTLPNPSEAEVLYDGEEINLADDYQDVLDPSGTSAEYLVLTGAKDSQLLVSVPSFSTHAITITTGAEKGGGLPLTLIVTATGIITVALVLAVYSVRKRSAPPESKGTRRKTKS